jgi:hypothetical protein
VVFLEQDYNHIIFIISVSCFFYAFFLVTQYSNNQVIDNSIPTISITNGNSSQTNTQLLASIARELETTFGAFDSRAVDECYNLVVCLAALLASKTYRASSH